MEYFVICLTAFFISGISLFSGFGLGTVLMPAFAVFFPLYIAIPLTAIVHFFNDVLKVVLLGRHADKKVVLQFGIPAIFTAIVGARALFWLAKIKPLAIYRFLNHDFNIMPVKLAIAVLMIVFALLELIPELEKISFERKYLPLGGALSGFLGGFSGHQGALRSAFLLKCGLSKESFIATGAVISCIVDMSRIFVYSTNFSLLISNEKITLLIAAITSAFLGAFLGNRLLKKITMRAIRLLIAIMLFAIAICLGSGIL